MHGMMEFYWVKQNGRICYPGEQPRLMQDYVDSLKDGTQGTTRISRLAHPKTDAQLKGFWGLFISTCLVHFNDCGYDTSYIFKTENPTGIPIYGDLIKEYLYNVCPVIAEGKRITMSSMSLEQMMKFYEDCCAYAASQWNIYIPECDRNWRQKQQQDPYKTFRKDNNGD